MTFDSFRLEKYGDKWGLSIGAGQTEEKIVGFYHINKMNKTKRKSTFLRFVLLNTETAKKLQNCYRHSCHKITTFPLPFRRICPVKPTILLPFFILQLIIKDENMQLIEHFYHLPQAKTWQDDPLLFVKVQSLFLSQHISFQTLLSSQTEMKSIVELKCKASSDQILSSFWTITIREHLQLKIQLADMYNQVSLSDVPSKIADFVKMINANTNGIYFWNKDLPKIIMFRYKLPFETSKNYLSSHMKEVYLEVSHQFRRFAVLANILPGYEDQAYKKLNDTLVRLKMLKEEFEFARQQRKRSTNCYNLTNSSIKLVSQALSLVNLCFGKLKGYAWDSKVDLSRCHKLYSNIKAVMQQNIGKQTDKLQRFIVKGVQIEQVYHEEVIDEGGFSKIRRGIYQFYELLTVSSNSINSMCLKGQDSERQKEKVNAALRKMLVRKFPKDEKDYSHLNEFQLLQFLRNQKSSHIAEYYLSNSPKEEFSNGIYIEYYQTNLAKAYIFLKEADLLKISRQILQGIHFFWKNKVLHRDLKELNVLLDQSGNAKLIDFGSSSGFFTNESGQFKAVNNRLMATKTYFFPYSDIRIPAITQKYQRQEFNQAETFDMYSFGQILNNIFSLEKVQDNIVYRQLVYLARKCQQMNPQDRMYPIQALCYLKEIISLHVQQNSIMSEQESVGVTKSDTQQ